MKMEVVDGKGIDTNFLHTDLMVLIDKNRNIRGYYHGLDATQIEKLANDIIFLTLERDAKHKSIFAGQFGLILIVFIITIVGIIVLVYFLNKFKT
jgi:protein SCO1/2